MTTNISLRYGFEWDRAYFIDFAMKFQCYLPIVAAFTSHPMMIYLLVFESKNMRKEIRRGYILSHLALLLDEWSFCFYFRIYPVIPYAALYCEGPLCQMDLSMQTLMICLSIPVVLINPPFNFLIMRLHQMFVPVNSRWKLRTRTQYFLASANISIMVSNVVGFAIFGKNHDESLKLLQEPELAWLVNRGGTLFLFGPPGDPKYFRWEVIILGLSILINTPPLVLFTADSMRTMALSSDILLSGSTQAMARRMFQDSHDARQDHQHCGPYTFGFWTAATIHYIIPLGYIFSCMMFDTTSIPGWIHAPSRFIAVIIFSLNGPEFSIYFIIKNPSHLKALVKLLNKVPFVHILFLKIGKKFLKDQNPAVIYPFSAISTVDRVQAERF